MHAPRQCREAAAQGAWHRGSFPGASTAPAGPWTRTLELLGQRGEVGAPVKQLAAIRLLNQHLGPPKVALLVPAAAVNCQAAAAAAVAAAAAGTTGLDAAVPLLPLLLLRGCGPGAAVLDHPHGQVVLPLLAVCLPIKVAAPAVRAAVRVDGNAAVHAVPTRAAVVGLRRWRRRGRGDGKCRGHA